MKIGIVFSGQGAQYPGMGLDLFNAYQSAKEVFEQAGEAMQHFCFEGTEEELKRTDITQPTVYTVSMAAYAAFMDEIRKNGIEKSIDVVGYAGFSLGEYSALTAAKSIPSISKGVEILKTRGHLMNEAGMDNEGNQKGGMVACIGKKDIIIQLVEEVKANDILQAVNFNTSKQTVIAGENEPLNRFRKLAKEKKIVTIPLPVSTAFHSLMMLPAALELKKVLQNAKLNEPQFPVYTNVTAENIMDTKNGDDVSLHLAEMLSIQAMNPVLWEKTINNMVKDGAEMFIEMGPGKTLTSFNKKICPSIQSFNIENKRTMETVLSAIGEE